MVPNPFTPGVSMMAPPSGRFYISETVTVCMTV